MRYQKPSIIKLGAASSAVQGIGQRKPMQVTDATNPEAQLSSGGAYDLDE
jgi:hypothetical protein